MDETIHLTILFFLQKHVRSQISLKQLSFKIADISRINFQIRKEAY